MSDKSYEKEYLKELDAALNDPEIQDLRKIIEGACSEQRQFMELAMTIVQTDDLDAALEAAEKIAAMAKSFARKQWLAKRATTKVSEAFGFAGALRASGIGIGR